MGNAIGGKIAKGDFRLVGRLAGEDGTQVAGGVASEKAPQGLGVMTVGIEIVEEARNGVGDFACGATIADGARNSGDLADAAADAEVVGVDHIGALFDFFPFDANVGDPMLTAGVGAAGDVDLDVFLVAGEAGVEFLGEPAGKGFGFGEGEFAEFGAGAGDGATNERRGLDGKAVGGEIADDGVDAGLGNVD